MLETPAGILATAMLLLAIGASIGIVIYTISLTMRATQQVDTPEATLETLGEAVRTLGRTADILTHALRGMVSDTSSGEPTPEKPIITPSNVVIEKATAIFNKPPKERTDEDFAFLEHYATSSLLRTMFNLGSITAEAVDRFALERHTPIETRKHLLTTLLETRTSDNTDSFQAVPDDSSSTPGPPATYDFSGPGRHSAEYPLYRPRVVASGRVVLTGAQPNGSAPR